MSMRLPRSAAAMVMALACTLPVCAVAPEIKDAAKFFSPEAVAKADKEIREIARKYDRDLLIETFSGVPGGQTERVKALSAPEREKFFANWAADRAEEAVVNGVYILVCKEPAHLQVVVTEKAAGVFNREAKGQLTRTLLKDFREKHFNEGLQAAVAFVRDRLAGANH
jgi:uncharacterized membrane protein YgcG